MTVLTTTVPWRFFDARVAAVQPLSPSFVRVTLTGPDLADFADNGLDQRFKLLLPAADGGFTHLPRDPDWYAGWRALPDAQRPPLRTYTVRAVRPEHAEVDVDMVRHGLTGPASTFAEQATPGDEVVVLGPNARFDGSHGGLEFRPPAAHLGPFLLAGDETAVPAIAVILEQLPAEAYGEVVLEVPRAEDRLPLSAPAGMRVTWAVRDGAAYGSALTPAVVEAVDRLDLPLLLAGEDVEDPAAEEVLWEVPDEAAVDAASRSMYAWLAGEARAITGLRRHLVRDVGVDKRAVAFMGYWREGVSGS